ncbi:hypothetical protein T4D_11477 [Trichinella pseudospiralis]|uniref:Uncharacterized protein n=1 Tax=Trichinella pseudospiralis TaxID=6337 RepID=A0A0V1F625_TRIPS|nr:hypothetical protein T4D_11477 [Trichinella pseudospiralis]
MDSELLFNNVFFKICVLHLSHRLSTIHMSSKCQF